MTHPLKCALIRTFHIGIRRLRYAGVLICSSLSILELSSYQFIMWELTLPWQQHGSWQNIYKVMLLILVQHDTLHESCEDHAWSQETHLKHTWNNRNNKTGTSRNSRNQCFFAPFFCTLLHSPDLHSPDLVFCSCRLLSNWYGERGMENEGQQGGGNKGQKLFSCPICTNIN